MPDNQTIVLICFARATAVTAQTLRNKRSIRLADRFLERFVMLIYFPSAGSLRIYKQWLLHLVELRVQVKRYMKKMTTMLLLLKVARSVIL